MTYGQLRFFLELHNKAGVLFDNVDEATNNDQVANEDLEVVLLTLIMKEETYGALKRIIEEVKEKRKFDCFNKHCVCSQMIGGNDIQLIEKWIKENSNLN